MPYIRFFVLLMCFPQMALASQSGSQSGFSSSQPVTIPFIDEGPKITIDGNFDEPQWASARVVELTVVTRPFENTSAPVKTTARIFENGNTLYIAFDAKDHDPSAIRAFYRDRDDIWGDDLVGVKLDTFGNSRLAYQYFVNPHGIQTDSIENELTRSESASWNAIWSSAGKIVDDGYRVEMALPFRIMNFDDTDGQKQWRAEFVRFYPRDIVYRLSNMPVDRNNACVLCQMGDIEGFEKAKQGKNIAIVPTLVTAVNRSRDPGDNPQWQSDDMYQAGVDINWGISSDILFQATVNPDFSQVEADAGQLGINNPFALFFPERRQFFLENADYFSTPSDIVYTRNIGEPDVGAKITGRMNKHSFGLLASNDKYTRFLVPGNLSSQIAELPTESFNTAARYRYDMSDTLSVGAILTARNADNYHNYVTGADTRYQLSDADVIRAQFLFSETEYPEDLVNQFCDNRCINRSDRTESALRVDYDGTFTGTLARFDYQHIERDWFMTASHTHRDRGFRADLGFESVVDRSKSVVGGGYVWWNETSWWNRLEFSGDWDITHNQRGELIEREVQAQLQINADYQSFAELQWVKRDRVGLREDNSILSIDGNTTRFTEQQVQLYAEAQPAQTVFFSGFVRTGDRIDFANNRLGDQLLIESSVVLNAGLHAKLSVDHSYNQLDADGLSVFKANLTDLRLSYQFDAQQFIRLAVIYSDIRRNQKNYAFSVEEHERNVGTQLVYSYMVNPLTRFFVGYNDNAFSNDTINGLTRDRQSLFMKYSYAWLL
ncbi:carbohydrate binding family 9 domain-containing protein [Alteromonas sp. CYL-A6]|uniref:carbohydrate binding family 9 domain-containing protein n=1 Tax=Alteromonas nitratireducens TaxID=3390813 RepID=UPI0034AB1762